MNAHQFSFRGTKLAAYPDGSLYCDADQLLVVSDLHLGKSERIARVGGALLPPYENTETLARLDEAITRSDPKTIICLGDTFDDITAAHSLEENERLSISRMQAGRRWIWITGNHDPAPVPLPGEQLAQTTRGQMIFRHISAADGINEVSGHYHPKARIRGKGRSFSRPCFLIDERKIIMPAFGVYTGGLYSHDPVLSGLMQDPALAIITGSSTALAFPMPRSIS